MNKRILWGGPAGSEAADALRRLLAERFAVPEDLDPCKAPAPEALAERDLVVLYSDFQGSVYPDDPALGLVSYVARGGSLLLVHGAATLGAARERYPYAHLAGGAVVDASVSGPGDYIADQADHPIMAGFAPFRLEGVSAFARLDRFSDKVVLFRQKHLTTAVPAGWAQGFGLGRVVVLLPGGSADDFRHPVYRRIIENSVEWMLNKKEADKP